MDRDDAVAWEFLLDEGGRFSASSASTTLPRLLCPELAAEECASPACLLSNVMHELALLRVAALRRSITFIPPCLLLQFCEEPSSSPALAPVPLDLLSTSRW